MPAGLGGAVIKSHGSYYQPNAVNFGGSGNYCTLTNPGYTNSGSITIAATIRWSTDGYQPFAVMHSNGYSGRFLLGRSPDSDKFELYAVKANNDSVLNAASSETLSLDEWYSILVSFDLSDAGNRHVYINDAAATMTWTTYIDDVIEFLDTDHTSQVGCREPDGGAPFEGDICDLWVDSNRYTDFSAESNRRLFFDAQGSVVYKGADGSLPFSVTPDVFLSGATASWHTNKGSIGGFTLTGTLGTTSDPPPGARL